MSLSADVARCLGQPIRQCQDCQRRTDPGHPDRQVWMERLLLAADQVCTYKIQGETQ